MYSFAAVLVTLIYSSSPAVAQTASSNADANQVVGLFTQCVRFAGDSAGLRAWISAHHLPEVPPEQAIDFLGTTGGGEVFGASTRSGQHALISYDDGSCQVIAETDDPTVVQKTLLSLLTKLGVSISLFETRAKPDESSTQQLYNASLGTRRWELSITSKPHADAPALPPEVRLLVTVATPRSS